MNREHKKIIIDTDAGHDDALAIMLLVKSGLFDIHAVTTVAGNSTIENVTRNAQAILDLLRIQTIPIHSGSSSPLSRELVQAVVHGESGLDGLDMSETIYSLTDDAVDVIIDTILLHPHEITLLTLGPLSNIARAIQKNPAIINKIKQIVIMGGAITAPGNKNRVAEFNIFVDPEAADIVFRAHVPKVLVPLDPCNDVLLPLEYFEKFKGSELHKPLMSMMAHFISGIALDEGAQGALVYDALAAYYLISPEAFTLEEMDVVVETKGEHTPGMTVAERRKNKSQKSNMLVATHIDDEKFRLDLLTYLKGV